MKNEFERYSYENLLKEALDRIPDTIDKREGSIIYDALAPSCYQLAKMYMDLYQVLLNSFVTTSFGEYLDNKVLEQGLSRYKETKAIKKGTFTFKNNTPAILQTGMRFTAIDQDQVLNYKIIDTFKDNSAVVKGEYLLECETPGTIGNSYIGDLLPIDHINNLETAKITSLVVPGRDIETDEELRSRYLIAINQKPFGGNISQYDSNIRNIEGVGEVQVYPTWNGPGTVKCSVVDSQYKPISSEFSSAIQEIIDPTQDGSGLGLAPIGHRVTITTPSITKINITGTIQLLTGYVLEQIKEDINNSIETYLVQLRKNWGVADELNRYDLSIYISQITAAILRVTGVANVTNVKINNSLNDLVLTQSSTTQQIPILESVEFI